MNSTYIYIFNNTYVVQICDITFNWGIIITHVKIALKGFSTQDFLMGSAS